MKTPFFLIGIVQKAHGVHGEMKVHPTTDDPGRFKKLKEVIVRQQNREERIPVESARFFKDTVLLKLRGVDDMDRAERFRKAELLVERKDAVPLKENEYYAADLLGMQVYEGERHLGELTEVLTTGANDVYVVKDENREILIPAIKECIKNVDVEENRMEVHLLEGLES